MRRLLLFYAFVLILPIAAQSQVKILWDCTKAETAGNADWVIDADLHNIDWESNDQIGSGTASNPQRYPTPAQNTVTSSTAETYWEGALSAWGIDCVNYGYEVETLTPYDSITYGNPNHAQDLMNYKVYVIDEPNIRFSQSEKNAILAFVKNGGGLFMISDHNNSDRNNDGWDSPNIWNDFLNTVTPINPFGIKFDLDYFSPSTTNVSTNGNDSIIHGPYGAVTELSYSGATIIHIYPDTNSTATGDIWMQGVSQSSHDSIMFAHAHFGSGKVAAIADSSPSDDGTGNPACTLYAQYLTGDNGSDRKMYMNAIIWLAESSVAVDTNSLSLVTPSNVTVCAGNSVTMTATGATSYSWAPGGQTTASITVQPSASGLYMVTGTTGNSSKTDTITVTVDQFSATLLQISPANPVACQGSSVILSAPSGYSYQWNVADSISQTLHVSQAGSYYFTATDANHCTAKSDTVHVTIDQFSQTTPQITANGPLTFCGGGSVTISAPTEAGYLWSGGETTSGINATQTGSYTATVTDANGCHATTNTLTVTTDAFSLTNPQISANGPVSFCTGGNVILSAPAGYTYSWSNSSTQQTITVSQTGIFYATITDGSNCHAQSDTVVVNVSAGINGVQLTPAGAQTICNGNSIGLTAPTGYSSYSWSNGSTTQAITVAQQGIYYVTVSTGSNCHGVSDTVSVSVDNFSSTTPQITAGGPLTFCQGGNVILSASGGTSYNWSNNTQQSSTTVSQSGNYSVTVTDVNQCSAVSNSLTVTVNQLPVITFQASPDSICSNAGSLLLTASPTGGTFSGTGVSGSQFAPSVSGVGNFAVTYSYTDGNSCSNSATSNITVYICTGIEDIIAQAIRVYPNPSPGMFLIQSTQDFSPQTIRVFDAMGRQVIEMQRPTTGWDLIRLDMRNFASGIYIAELEQNNILIRKKLLKAE